jgi:TetR/AcrR family transcriptional regulator
MNAEKSFEAATARLSSEDRREQILEAASVVFAERGYAGGTTDAVAKRAGISQAYVVRMFGSKEQLFVEVATRASERVAAGFRASIAGFDGTETDLDKQSILGQVYSDLVADRGILLVLMHLFTLGHDPTFGPISRTCFLNIYRIARDEAGLGPAVATEFVARGMLMNTILAMRIPDVLEDEPDAVELLQNCAGATTGSLIQSYEAQA